MCRLSETFDDDEQAKGKCMLSLPIRSFTEAAVLHEYILRSKALAQEFQHNPFYQPLLDVNEWNHHEREIVSEMAVLADTESITMRRISYLLAYKFQPEVVAVLLAFLWDTPVSCRPRPSSFSRTIQHTIAGRQYWLYHPLTGEAWQC